MSTSNIFDLPLEMVDALASFLDQKSLQTLSETCYEAREWTKRRIAKQNWFKADKNYLEQIVLPRSLSLPIRHISIGADWVGFNYPIAAFLRRFEMRGHPFKNIRSVQLEQLSVKRKDLEMLMDKVEKLKTLSFGKYRVRTRDDEQKTLIMTTNTNLDNAEDVLRNFGRIVVRSFGPPSPVFLESLQKLLSVNAETLRELDIQGIPNSGLLDFEGINQLTALWTTMTLTTLAEELPSMSMMKNLKCLISQNKPTLQYSPNMHTLILDIGIAEYDCRDLNQFFPNLENLEMKSNYGQHTSLQKITFPKLSLMRGRNFGVINCCNIIAPELETFEMMPLSDIANKHLAMHSKKLKTIRGRDLLTDKITVIKNILLCHPTLNILQLKHSAYVCACDIKTFVKTMKIIAEENPVVLKTKCEFFFEANMKHLENLMDITLITGCEIRAFHNNLRIIIGGEMSVFIKLVDFETLQRRH